MAKIINFPKHAKVTTAVEVRFGITVAKGENT